MTATDLNTQQAVDAQPKPMQQINFTENLDRGEKRQYISLLKEQKNPFKVFHQSIMALFCFDILSR